MYASNEKELGEAIKNNEDTIEVYGDFGKKVFRIHATKKAAWIVASGCLAVAIGAAIATIASVGTTSLATVPMEAASLTAATVAFGGGAAGLSAAKTAVAIGVVGGGFGTLKKLRKYKIKKYGDRVILTRK